MWREVWLCETTFLPSLPLDTIMTIHSQCFTSWSLPLINWERSGWTLALRHERKLGVNVVLREIGFRSFVKLEEPDIVFLYDCGVFPPGDEDNHKAFLIAIDISYSWGRLCQWPFGVLLWWDFTLERPYRMLPPKRSANENEINLHSCRPTW